MLNAPLGINGLRRMISLVMIWWNESIVTKNCCIAIEPFDLKFDLHLFLQAATVIS